MPERAPVSQRTVGPDVVATHISLLVLTGDRVLKFRKPIATDFCDFTTLGARRHDCEREVELNRRLTDDVYLGVGRVQLDGGDAADSEPCVIMRRLPADRLLAELVAAGVDLTDEVRAIAARLAAFHDSATRVTATDGNDGDLLVRARWADAIAQLRPHARDDASRATLEEIHRLSTRWCDGRAPLFLARLADGFVRDGHGDLRAENIYCLDDGPRILDCIEFDDELRHIDVATDLAFLVMDLRRLGRQADAESLIVEYGHASGAALPRGLVDHDVAYWALVRAKVAHLRATQGDPRGHEEAAHLEGFALDQLRRARVRMVLVGGLPGTGKSTLAGQLAAETGWTILSTDLVRKELAGVPATARTGDGYQTGLYRPEQIDATYAELLHRARWHLERGESVIVDASWRRTSHRDDAAAVAHAAGAELHALACFVEWEVARARLAARVEAGTDASDADASVAEQMATTFEPWPDSLLVDTTGPTEPTCRWLRQQLGVDDVARHA